MKTFRQRIADYEYYCSKLKLAISNKEENKIIPLLSKIKETGLDLSHSDEDYISLYFLNSKELHLNIFLALHYQKSPLNSFNHSLIKSYYHKDSCINKEEALYMLSFYKKVD